MKIKSTTRRSFNKITAGGAAAAFAWPAGVLADPYTSRVALTKSPDRADNAFRAMQVFKREIAAAIATAEIQAPLKRVRRRPWQNELCPAGFAMTDD